MTKVFNAPRAPVNKWGIKAVEKDKLRKPTLTLPEKKRHRKMIEASKRRNRK